MPREIDPRRTRKALRAVRKLSEAPPAELSEWEQEFLGEVGARLERYGSAFHDLAKGRPDAALSDLQALKLREIAGKGRRGDGADAKPRKGLSRGQGFKRAGPKRPPPTEA